MGGNSVAKNGVICSMYFCTVAAFVFGGGSSSIYWCVLCSSRIVPLFIRLMSACSRFVISVVVRLSL
jgi:hypothetical protein